MKDVLPLLMTLLLFVGCSKQQNVAVVGDEFISTEQFKERYQQYLSNAQQRDNILLRKQILTNMINEILILKDLKERGLDRDEIALKKLEEIRTQAILDVYAMRISSDTVTASEQELYEEFRRMNTKVAARYVYAPTEHEALQLKQRLERGETFQTIAKEVFDDPGLANNGGYLGIFGWGEMEQPLEEICYTLPIGSLSDPVKLSMGYAIIRVEQRIQIPLASEYDFAQNKTKLERAILERKVKKLVADAAYNLRNKLRPLFKEDVVQSLLQHWQLFSSQSTMRSVQESSAEHFVLPPSTPLVQFYNGEWTVGDFLEKAKQLSERQRRYVKTADDVKDVVLGLAIREELLKQASLIGVEKDERVSTQIKRVSEEFFLKRWASLIQDTVGASGFDESLLKKHFEENKEQYILPPEVNVAEILVESREKAESLLIVLKKGADFAQLARKYSLRVWAAKRGGELGYGTKAMYGPLGEKFFSASIDDIIGPEFVDPYYGVFKILARRETKHMTFDEAKESIVEGFRQAKKQEALKTALEQLRMRTEVSIDMDILANIVLN